MIVVIVVLFVVVSVFFLLMTTVFFVVIWLRKKPRCRGGTYLVFKRSNQSMYQPGQGVFYVAHGQRGFIRSPRNTRRQHVRASNESTNKRYSTAKKIMRGNRGERERGRGEEGGIVS